MASAQWGNHSVATKSAIAGSAVSRTAATGRVVTGRVVTGPAILEIVVPARNEARRLPDGLAALCQKAAMLPLPTAIVVVDSASTDGTTHPASALLAAGQGDRCAGGPAGQPGAVRRLLRR